jgi:hypothetical protein
VLVAVAVAAVATGVFLIVRTGIVDDAYITLDYARNLAFHLHWGLVAGQTANTATYPLDVLVQGLLTAILRRPVLALGVLFVLSNMVVALALLRVTRALRLPGWASGRWSATARGARPVPAPGELPLPGQAATAHPGRRRHRLRHATAGRRPLLADHRTGLDRHRLRRAPARQREDG